MEPVVTPATAASDRVETDPLIVELDELASGLPELSTLPLADAVGRLTAVHDRLQAALTHLDRT
jgi:hypothetical protein